MLLGMLLTNYAPVGKNDWKTYDMFAGLGLSKDDYKKTVFKSTGSMKSLGLVPGESILDHGRIDIFDQDVSIMSWTAGFLIASARDVAKFYWDLLGPYRTLLSDERLEEMMHFSSMRDIDFSYPRYGGGLMILNLDGEKDMWETYEMDDELTYFGHEGLTYGYNSKQGYFPQLELSFSMLVNNDYDLYSTEHYVRRLIRVVMSHKGNDPPSYEEKPKQMQIRNVQWVCNYKEFYESEKSKDKCVVAPQGYPYATVSFDECHKNPCPNIFGTPEKVTPVPSVH